MEEGSIKRVEINYRGITQKRLAKNIANYVVYVAYSEGKTAFSNGRYSDAPERDGVPCKYFAFVSPTLSDSELEAVCGASMDIDTADISVVLDDTMVKGVEPWGNNGIRPINEKIVKDSVMLVVSQKKSADLLKFVATKPFDYRVAILDGNSSFSGLWVYKDDLTDIRILGAIAKVDPGIISINAVEKFARVKFKDGELRAQAARKAYDSVAITKVSPSDGIVWPYKIPELPKWNEMEEGLVIPAVKRGYVRGPRGQSRNPDYMKGTSKSVRPVVRFDLCTKCTLCWMECPDEAFDPTNDGLYDVNYDYCTGCGKCAEVCPVKDCIVMVDDLKFGDNSSPWEFYKKDPRGYVNWVESKKGQERIVPEYIRGKGEKVVKVQTIPYRGKEGNI